MTFLSDDWLASSVAVADDGSVAGSFSGRVAVEVGGGPGGKVLAALTFEDGRLTSAETGPVDDADVGLTLKYDDARSLLAGERDLNALFISGQMKVAGDTGPLLEMIAATKGEEFTAFRTRLAAATDD